MIKFWRRSGRFLLIVANLIVALYFALPAIMGILTEKNLWYMIEDFLLFTVSLLFVAQIIGLMAPQQRHPEKFRFFDGLTLVLFIIEEVFLLLAHQFNWWFCLIGLVTLVFSHYWMIDFFKRGETNA